MTAEEKYNLAVLRGSIARKTGAEREEAIQACQDYERSTAGFVVRVHAEEPDITRNCLMP